MRLTLFYFWFEFLCFLLSHLYAAHSVVDYVYSHFSVEFLAVDTLLVSVNMVSVFGLHIALMIHPLLDISVIYMHSGIFILVLFGAIKWGNWI